MKQPMKYRLGLDLGTNSLGWCVVALDDNDSPVRIMRIGVRIFKDGRDPKSGASLAADRRLARGMRRRRDRFLRRRTRLLRLLIEYALLPKDAEARRALRALDPYVLRKRGLDEPLSPHEFGRAIFHLNQRRGFKSNRRVNKEDDDAGKIASAVSRVRTQMSEANARTVGEWLAQRHASRQPVRARLLGEGAKSSYELYVQRSMIEDEFNLLWSSQAAFNPAICSSAARAAIHDAVFYQRRLRPVEPGRCRFEQNEFRAPLALPTVQRFRILQEANHLRYRAVGGVETSLTLGERDRVVDYLSSARSRTFDQLRRLLGLADDVSFNLESPKRSSLKGSSTAAILGSSKVLGRYWYSLSLPQQDELASMILDIEDEVSLHALLMEKFGIPETLALAATRTRLDDEFGSLSLKAIRNILPHLESDVRTYDQAAAMAGYEHSRRNEGGDLPKLPYYAEYVPEYVGTGTYISKDPPERRYGRISNPTVHVGLNQLRTVVNAIIGKYGRPEQIVIELARDLKLSRSRKQELEKEQAENQARAEARRAKLLELGLPVNAGNMLRLRLWEELAPSPTDRRCPYSGEMISCARLFSDEIEIEHILPFAATLDDSATNKTVATRKANRDKGRRSPFEAFGHSPGDYQWQAILDRAALMPPAKRRRFAEDALQQFAQDGDFLARHLTDTAYLARVAREYLAAVTPSNRVWAIPGRLTAMLRARWGLNRLLSDVDQKNRTDHRHHAIDAAVVAATDGALLQRMSRLSASGHSTATQRFLEDFEQPWEQFRDQLQFGLKKTTVSFKPDHGLNSKLHNETAYGLVDLTADFSQATDVVHRKPITSIQSAKELILIRDPALRAQLEPAVREKSGKELRAALDSFSAEHGTRRIRVIERMKVIPIRNEVGSAYKAYKGDSNHSVLIYEDPNTGRWRDIVISSFEAARGIAEASEEQLIMHLHIDDTIRVVGDTTEVLRVVKISAGRISFAAHHEGGALKARDADHTDPFRYRTWSARRLQELKAEQVVVDPIGQVWPFRRADARKSRRDR
jgi:CRISPR-associated endonuclease Csn1